MQALMCIVVKEKRKQFQKSSTSWKRWSWNGCMLYVELWKWTARWSLNESSLLRKEECGEKWIRQLKFDIYGHINGIDRHSSSTHVRLGSYVYIYEDRIGNFVASGLLSMYVTYIVVDMAKSQGYAPTQGNKLAIVHASCTLAASGSVHHLQFYVYTPVQPCMYIHTMRCIVRSSRNMYVYAYLGNRSVTILWKEKRKPKMKSIDEVFFFFFFFKIT